MTSDDRRITPRHVHTLFEVGTLGGLTDDQLLGRFSTREGAAAEAAFAGLVERHGPMVFRVCRSILADSHAAQDAFQATFLVLVQKADSLRVQGSLGPWLHQVAVRVASCARSAEARRRRHESKAAETAVRPEAEPEPLPADVGPALHEEVDALPERFRSVVVLCYLEGLTHSQAARKLGWPDGTVQSRLARGRDRLRDRMLRRGFGTFAIPLGSAGVPTLVEPPLAALFDSTVRAASLLGAGGASVAEAASPAIARLMTEVSGGLVMSHGKFVLMSLVALFAVGAGGYAFQSPPDAAPEVAEAPAQQDALEAAWEEGGRLTPPQLDFGPLRVGALGQAGASIILDVKDGEPRAMTAKVSPPDFLRVRSLRVRERDQGEKRFIELGLSIDTTRAGEFSGQVLVEYGDRKFELPVTASVLPDAEGLTKVLIVAPDALGGTDDPGYFRPWFNLIEAVNLDVSYLDPSDVGLPVDYLGQGAPVLSEGLTRYDVIVLADGASLFTQGGDVALENYVRGGGRLIVNASSFGVGTIPTANAILKPFGLEFLDEDVSQRGAQEWSTFSCFARPDALTEGVESVAFHRASPVRVVKGERGEILLRDPDGDANDLTRGFAAVARDGGGEVIALGPALLFSWICEKETGPANARFLRNLLTRTRDR